MRWLFTSWGSRGDLHPFLALGRGLLARGHGVTLVGHPEWQDETELAGLRFAATNEPPRGNLLRDHPQILSSRWGGIPSLHALTREVIAPSFAPLTETLLREASAHDVLVAHHFVFPATVVADLLHLPWATVTLAPGVVPSAYSLPGAQFGRSGHGPLMRLRNRVIWRAGKWCTRRMVDPVVNRLRRQHGLGPVRNAVFDAHSPHLNLQLYSPHFAAPPPDWSGEKRQAGFCFFDPPGAKLSAEIDAFLQRGDAPVLFTLGSTAVKNPGQFYETAVEVCLRTGVRGLLLIGEEENRPAKLPDSILATNYAPYGLLMPRVRAVVHQCGIGTLSQALRAGLPSVAVPFAFDQPNNACRLEELGVAELVLPGGRQAGRMSEALQKLLSGNAPLRARQLGEAIRAEDGVARACAILEETFAS
jgi:UDP:flavonoid glycosyltransferase YjiC (YdhE family)